MNIVNEFPDDNLSILCHAISEPHTNEKNTLTFQHTIQNFFQTTEIFQTNKHFILALKPWHWVCVLSLFFFWIFAKRAILNNLELMLFYNTFENEKKSIIKKLLRNKKKKISTTPYSGLVSVPWNFSEQVHQVWNNPENVKCVIQKKKL